MQKSSAGPAQESKSGRWRVKRITVEILCLAVLTMLFRSALTSADSPYGDAGRCANTGVTDAYQPSRTELANALELAASNNLGSGYEQLPNIEVGYPNSTLAPGSAPCVILKAIAFVESSWHQAHYSAPRGSSGVPLVSSDCGYGVMQITSGMTSYGAIDPAIQQRIAREYRYNVSYGAKMLVGKWNYAPVAQFPAVGSRNPAILEDWYYAVWAYNGMSSRNNPIYFSPSRPPFDGSQPRGNYPYQELVWGYAANPPYVDGVRAWNPQPITLPPDLWITDPPGYIPDPSPTHSSDCSGAPPAPPPTPTATPVPILRASTTSLAFLAEPGKTPVPQNIQLTGANSTPLTWSIPSQGATWISPSPLSGSAPATVRVSPSISGMNSGDRRSSTFTIRNTSNLGQQDFVINVSLYYGPLRKLIFPQIFR